MGDTKIKIVTTVSGKQLPRTRCRFIRGKFYETGKVNIKNSGDCFRVTDCKGITRYRTLETGAVVWDDSIQKYVHKTMLGNVVGIIDSNGNEGGFKETSDNVFIVKDGKKIRCKNKLIAKNLGYVERVADGYYYKKSQYDPYFLNKKVTLNSDYKYSLPYNCDRVMDKYKKSYSKYTIPENISKDIEDLYFKNPRLFDNYTFGVEFETTRGKIPDHICEKLGLIPLRDGSIAGIEYATVPLTGLRGLYTLLEVYENINTKTDNDFNCSMHIHVGGFERTEKNILSLFKTMFMMQDDIYQFFPLYKKTNLGVKKKNYTAPLPNNVFAKMNFSSNNSTKIREDIHKLIYFLSGKSYGYENMALSDVKNHPQNPGNDRKWGMRARYLWFNLIPVIFTNKKTVEFRIFGMPNSKQKMFAFLAMSLGLVSLAINSADSILKDPDALLNYNLNKVFSHNFRGTMLEEYMFIRRDHVTKLVRNRGTGFTERDIK